MTNTIALRNADIASAAISQFSGRRTLLATPLTFVCLGDGRTGRTPTDGVQRIYSDAQISAGLVVRR